MFTVGGFESLVVICEVLLSMSTGWRVSLLNTPVLILSNFMHSNLVFMHRVKLMITQPTLVSDDSIFFGKTNLELKV